MKKMIALLLVAMMMLGMVNAFAEDEIKEITWQDIPWGSTKKEIIATLIENQWIQSEKQTVFAEYGSDEWAWASFMTENGCICDWVDTNLLRNKGINVLATERGEKIELTIAGYTVKELAFTFGPDGTLMSIGISFENGDTDDLIQKLITVYGESELAVDSEDYYNLYFRQGDNETALALVDGNFWGDSPYLVYGKTTWEAVLGIQLIEPKQEIDSSNTSGL